jgi:hypothetical protein
VKFASRILTELFQWYRSVSARHSPNTYAAACTPAR